MRLLWLADEHEKPGKQRSKFGVDEMIPLAQVKADVFYGSAQIAQDRLAPQQSVKG
jgi:hypothetical protein